MPPPAAAANGATGMNALYTLRRDGKHTVVELEATSFLAPGNVDRMGRELLALGTRRTEGRLVLDFTRVTYVSSHGMGMILNLQRKLPGAPGGEGQLVLYGVNPALMRLIKLTRLDAVLNIRPTLREAVAT